MTTVKELIQSVNCDLNVLGDVKATQCDLGPKSVKW